MVRSLSANTTTKAATALGTEPSVIIKVEWPSGTVYYGDKAYSLTGITVKAAILDFASVVSQQREDSSSEISTATVKLDDTDGTLKTVVNNDILEGVAVTVYHHYDGNDTSDLLIILSGRIAGDINWSEGERSLTFGIESFFENNEIGYAPDSDDVTNIHPDAIDVPWPLCYGSPLKVPAVRVRRQPYGVLTYGINQKFSSFQIDGGDSFPQGSSVNIRVGRIRYSGTFSGSTFTVTGKNLAYHTNLDLANRPTNDVSYRDASVVWLDTSTNIVGLFCYVDHPTEGEMINYCIKQEGKKCYFAKPWRPNATTKQIILNATHTILETAPVPRGDWGINYVNESIANYNFTPGYWLSPVAGGEVVVGGVVTWSGIFGIKAGTVARLEATYDDLYVFNLLPSLRVYDVYGWRTNENGERSFDPIPSSYYTKYLNNTLGPKTCSYLTFDIPLEERAGEGWDGSVYVSCQSSKGPNGASVLRHLIETYTSLSIDTTSFNSVSGKLTKFPCNFAFFDQPTALEACEEIAWQLRCALIIRNGIVYLKYLGEVPTADQTVTEADVILKSMNLSFTSTENIYTKLNATWNYDYSAREGKTGEYTYRNNVASYGLRELDYDFYIYNNRPIVKKVADFWGYRLSNSWRRIQLDTVLTTLKLETFDTLAVAVDIFSTNTIRTVIDLHSHDSNDDIISIEGTMASKAGDSSGGQPIEDTQYWGDGTTPTYNDPTGGLQESDYLVPTQGQTDSDTDSDTGTIDDAEDEPVYYLAVYTPSIVQRNTNFEVRVEAQDYTGAIYNDTFQATITFADSDGSNPEADGTVIQVVNGVWTTTTAQITAGSGTDTAAIVAVAPNYVTGVSAPFTVIDQKTDTLSWDTSPSTVTRETTFSIAISGGGSGEELDIALASGDSADRLYDSTGQVTSITLDSSGAFSASDWYIKGGDDTTVGYITMGSATFEETACDSFTITGLSVVQVTQTLTFTQEVVTNQNTVEVTQSGTIDSGIQFTLTVTVYDSTGAVDTTYNGFASVTVLNQSDAAIDWIATGDDSVINDNTIIVEIVNGVWSSTACELNIESGTTQASFTAQTPYPEWVLEDTLDVMVGNVTLVFTTTPSSIIRGENFTLSIEVQDAGGSRVTGAAPTVTLSLIGGNSGDALNTTEVNLVAGYWTSSAMQITGGSGSVTDAYITATASGYNSGQSANIIIGDVSATRAVSAYGVFYDSSTFATSDPATHWVGVQDFTIASFDADTTLGSGSFRHTATYETIYSRIVTTYGSGYHRFPLQAADKANGLDLILSLNMLLYEYVINPSPVYSYMTDAVLSDRVLNVYLSESSSTFGSGAALRAMTPHKSFSLQSIKDLRVAAGYTPQQSAAIDLPLDAGSFLSTMSGSDLYVWYNYTGGAWPYTTLSGDNKTIALITDVTYLSVKVIT